MQDAQFNHGDTVLVQGDADLSHLVSDIQCLKNKQSGIYSHSFKIYVDENGDMWASEAAQIQGHKFKAAIVLTPIEHYTSDLGINMLILRPRIKSAWYDYIFNNLVRYYGGTPYAYEKLSLFELIYYTVGKWLGKKSNDTFDFVCHQWVQFIDNCETAIDNMVDAHIFIESLKANGAMKIDESKGLFCEYPEAQISAEFDSAFYNHISYVR